MNQTYDMYQDDEVNRQNAEKYVEEKFRKPLYEFKFPPRADVCFEGKCWLILCHSVVRLIVQPYEQTCIFPKQVNIRIR
jgi:hypothetical protein